MRLTIDRCMNGWPTADWTFAAPDAGVPLLAGQAILELKFRSELTSLFGSLVAEIALTLSALSKYRLYHHVTGVVAAAPDGSTP